MTFAIGLITGLWIGAPLGFLIAAFFAGRKRTYQTALNKRSAA